MREASGIAKHSVMIAGHRTSISLEDAFWRALREDAARRGIALAAAVAEIDAARGGMNLCAAIRVAMLQRLEAQVRALREPAEPAAPAAS